MRHLSLVVILMLLVSAPVSVKAQSAAHEAIIVTGRGRVTATPDVGVINLTVESTETSSDSAAAVVASLVQGILDAISELDGTGIEVVTESYTVKPGRRGQRTQEPIEYMAATNFSVRVSGVTDVGGVVDAALRAGAVQIRGITFEVSDSDDLRERALAAAIEDADRQAKMIADAMGVGLSFQSATTQAREHAAGSLRVAGVVTTPFYRPTFVQPRDAATTVTVTMRFGVVRP